MSATERPILFSGPMVRAILKGRKTQTRRVVTPQPEHGVEPCHYSRTGWAARSAPNEYGNHGCTCRAVRAYGFGGDVLWVRETFAEDGDGYVYRADAHRTAPPERDGWWIGERYLGPMTWRPSIFMPRRACRIRLPLVGVRVERLQTISEADVSAEGVPQYEQVYGVLTDPDCVRNAFARLWNEINGKRAPWSSNPWVWVLEWSAAEVAP